MSSLSTPATDSINSLIDAYMWQEHSDSSKAGVGKDFLRDNFSNLRKSGGGVD